MFYPIIKELKLVFPNSQRMNRGNHVLGELIQACRANNVTDLIIVHEHRGQPGNVPMYSTQIGITTFAVICTR